MGITAPSFTFTSLCGAQTKSVGKKTKTLRENFHASPQVANHCVRQACRAWRSQRVTNLQVVAESAGGKGFQPPSTSLTGVLDEAYCGLKFELFSVVVSVCLTIIHTNIFTHTYTHIYINSPLYSWHTFETLSKLNEMDKPSPFVPAV